MLNKTFINLLIFGLALNCVIYLFGAFQINPPGYSTPFMDLSTWSGWFNFTPWGMLFTAASIAGMTFAAILLRQSTYAIYALLLGALGLIIKPVADFILAIPNAIGKWLPDSTNPIYPLPNPIIVVILLLFSFMAFWFIFGLVIQRDVN